MESVIVKDEPLEQYSDLLANVRHDGKYHSVRQLVQPNDREVRDVARLMAGAEDFVAASHAFVHAYTSYAREVGDYWATPGEMMMPRCARCESSDIFLVNSQEDIFQCLRCGYAGKPLRAGDCDDSSILLCSLLRNYLPADQVYCAFGTWPAPGDKNGHMWVIMGGRYMDDDILESTAPPGKPLKGQYTIYGIFNDQNALATRTGIREFALKPVRVGALTSVI